MRDRLALEPPPPGGSLDEWLLARPMPRFRLQLLALSVYCCYRLVNHLRHHQGHATTEYCRRFLNQCLVEGLRDDRKLRATLARHRGIVFAGRRSLRRAAATTDAYD